MIGCEVSKKRWGGGGFKDRDMGVGGCSDWV